LFDGQEKCQVVLAGDLLFPVSAARTEPDFKPLKCTYRPTLCTANNIELPCSKI